MLQTVYKGDDADVPYATGYVIIHGDHLHGPYYVKSNGMPIELNDWYAVKSHTNLALTWMETVN